MRFLTASKEIRIPFLHQRNTVFKIHIRKETSDEIKGKRNAFLFVSDIDVEKSMRFLMSN